MTNEEKQLLIKALCEMLPYGVICGWKDNKQITNKLIGIIEDKGKVFLEDCDWCEIEHIIPYLRPMSSMTKEEVVEYLSVCNNDYKDALTTPMYSGVDWLNSHHFDYRGLIERGLALEAPEGMYKAV